uniref:MPN domain-containing protein-like n=1 Tax=Oncorhynchus gorbuscha TaxID=8017 RepID=UPI001EAE8DBF|nr:MPN domain-containing protein-like [Oncorhynchus gorbuscha]XP_046208633.1 MPN domain-containing protein-like [Oncorhynchus gorbuscha]XP_046208634.1 MPN domain-containing protein-like [Oncorhynchus gorbuscha]XP_046208635.1 MPN domain-containing protein-like [Oncorhynchus gorbuscha]
MAKSTWIHAHQTFHSKIMAVNMELVHFCCYNSLHSSGKAFHQILEHCCVDLLLFSHMIISEVRAWRLGLARCRLSNSSQRCSMGLRQGSVQASQVLSHRSRQTTSVWTSLHNVASTSLKLHPSLPPSGKKFLGDLFNDGKICWVETGQTFNSPSAWATHCKRLVNPAKKSGCGWASVRYRGQKRVQYKTSWLHKYQPSADMSLVSEVEDDAMGDEEEGKTALPTGDKSRKNKPELHDISLVPRGGDREIIPIRYSTLGTRIARGPHTLVGLSAFSAIKRFQPFNVLYAAT